MQKGKMRSRSIPGTAESKEKRRREAYGTVSGGEEKDEAGEKKYVVDWVHHCHTPSNIAISHHINRIERIVKRIRDRITARQYIHEMKECRIILKHPVHGSPSSPNITDLFTLEYIHSTRPNDARNSCYHISYH